MTIQMQYEYTLPTLEALMFKTGTMQYEVIYPEQLDNGTTKFICRKLKKRTVDFSVSPPTWGSETEIDIGTPSGFTNPIIGGHEKLGYNFETDEILIPLGEWDGSSEYMDVTEAKLLAVKRDFSSVTVIQSDLFSLVKSAISDATRIYFSLQFWGYGGKIAGIAQVYADSGSGAERSCIILYDGSSWSAVHANSRYDYVQQAIEPIWDAGNNFLGWLTTGHGTNSHRISYPDLTITAGYPGGLFTTEPIYDPINHKVIWIEWGSSTGATQNIWVAEPTDPFNATNVTPSGSITDNEGNTINLAVECKAKGAVFSDGAHKWLVMCMYDNPGRTFRRTVKVTLGSYSNADAWSVIATPDNTDTINIFDRCRAINPTTKLFEPIPLFIVVPETWHF